MLASTSREGNGVTNTRLISDEVGSWNQVRRGRRTMPGTRTEGGKLGWREGDSWNLEYSRCAQSSDIFPITSLSSFFIFPVRFIEVHLEYVARVMWLEGSRNRRLEIGPMSSFTPTWTHDRSRFDPALKYRKCQRLSPPLPSPPLDPAVPPTLPHSRRRQPLPVPPSSLVVPPSGRRCQLLSLPRDHSVSTTSNN
jgi:hypothetical protein